MFIFSLILVIQVRYLTKHIIQDIPDPAPSQAALGLAGPHPRARRVVLLCKLAERVRTHSLPDARALVSPRRQHGQTKN